MTIAAGAAGIALVIVAAVASRAWRRPGERPVPATGELATVEIAREGGVGAEPGAASDDLPRERAPEVAAGALATPREIRGRVIAPLGATPDPATVVVASFPESGELRARLDADGRFRVPIPDGATRAALDVDSARWYLPRPVRVHALDDLAEELVLAVLAYGAIEVRIDHAADSLSRRDSVTVELEAMARTRGDAIELRPSEPPPRWQAETREGRALFERLRADRTYRITCVPRQHPPVTKTDVAVAPGETARITIELSGVGRVRGRVLDSAGQPIASAKVAARVRRGDEEAVRASAYARDDGSFEMIGVPAGELTVLATIPTLLDGGDGALLPLEALGLGWSVEVPAGWIGAGELREIDVVAPASSDVVGRVRWRDGRPGFGADVRVRSERAADGSGAVDAALRVRADGRFAFRLPRGARVEIFACTDAGETASWNGAVGAERVELDLVLECGRTVPARLVADAGAALPSRFELVGWVRSPLGLHQRGFRRSVSTADGRFDVCVPAGGDGTVTVLCPDEPELVTTTHATITPDVVEVVLHVRRTATLSGIVVDAEGRVVPGASIELAWSEPRATEHQVGAAKGWRRCTSGEDGSFRFEDIPPSDVRVLITEHEETALELTLGSGEHREGVVLEL